MTRPAEPLLASITLILSMAFMQNALAVDFGTKGRKWSIEEQDILEMIDERGKLVDQDELKARMRAKAKKTAEEPLAVDFVNPAEEGRVYWFDPSYVLEKDAYLPNKRLFYKAGTRVNPLKEMQKFGASLDRRMIFIDARKRNQVEWLKDMLKREYAKQQTDELISENDRVVIENKIILVGGRPFDLQEELQEEYDGMVVYFDQGAAYSRKMGIRASPALVIQDGHMLKIEEFVIEED